MPLARYFVFVGGVLVALLFVVGWIWPSSRPVQSQETTAQAAVDAPIARIHSTQKWPDKIEFDTSKPIIVPPAAPEVAAMVPAAPVVAENTVAASPLDARAEAKPDVQPAPSRKRVAKAHHRSYPRQTTSRWANAYPMAPSWGGWNW